MDLHLPGVTLIAVQIYFIFLITGCLLQTLQFWIFDILANPALMMDMDVIFRMGTYSVNCIWITLFVLFGIKFVIAQGRAAKASGQKSIGVKLIPHIFIQSACIIVNVIVNILYIDAMQYHDTYWRLFVAWYALDTSTSTGVSLSQIYCFYAIARDSSSSSPSNTKLCLREWVGLTT
jgi:hypothetical protein